MRRYSNLLFLILPLIIFIFHDDSSKRHTSLSRNVDWCSLLSTNHCIFPQLYDTHELTTNRTRRHLGKLQERPPTDQGPNGKLTTTLGSTNYIEEAIHERSPRLLDPFANESVVVDPAIHIPNIDIQLSNGGREYGWYGKTSEW